MVAENKKTAKYANSNSSKSLSAKTKEHSFTQNEEEYLNVRLNYPEYDLLEVTNTLQQKTTLTAEEIRELWVDTSLNNVLADRLDKLISAYEISSRNRLLGLADKLSNILVKRFEEFENGVDDPKVLLTGSSAFTANEVSLILKSTFWSMSPKDMMTMAVEASKLALSKDSDGVIDSNLMEQLSDNYHKYVIKGNANIINVSQFLADGFEGGKVDDQKRIDDNSVIDVYPTEDDYEKEK